MRDQVLAPAAAHGTFNWEVWGWGNRGGGRLMRCTEGVFHIRRDAAQVMVGEMARERHTDSTEDTGWEGKRMACGW